LPYVNINILETYFQNNQLYTQK